MDIQNKEVLLAHQGYRYQLFSPLGTYPRQTLHCNFGSYYFSEQCAFVVTNELSSADHLLKLQAAILLSGNRKKGFIKLYSLPYQHQIILPQDTKIDYPLITEDIAYKKSHHYRAPEETIPEFELYENAKGASLPLLLGGTFYNAFDELIAEDDFKDICNALENIDSEELNLSLTTLLSSNQLSCHFQFQQQANFALLESMGFYEKFVQRYFSKSLENKGLLEMLQKLNASSCSASARHKLAAQISPKDYYHYFQKFCHCLQKDLLLVS